jgi:hypothetical protein
MHSIKNFSERNKIDTQSRADSYIRRKRLSSKKLLSLLGKYIKKPKNPKNPKNSQKSKKKIPLG